MTEEHDLKRSLGPLQVWALAVGLVISGEYFGWNIGWGVSGTFGLLVSTAAVSLFFMAFVLSLTELSTSIPDAGGPYAYAQRALSGPLAHLTAICTLIEFIFAPPAIAFALGAYVEYLMPDLDKTQVALAMMLVFGAINFFSVNSSARFELFVTLLAVVELLLFIGVMTPRFEWANFAADGWRNGAPGIFASIPYAVWLFLGIEGVAMVSEEVKQPHRNLPIGYITGIITLVLLAFGVMFAAGGFGNWKELGVETNSGPIPMAAGMAFGSGAGWASAFAGIGVFGLVASLNGLIIGASRQLFAVSRARMMPYTLSRVNRFASPYLCVALTTGIGVICILSGETGPLIVISGLGATAMYVLCMVSLFALRRREPELQRPFKVPLYPIIPGFALVAAVICFAAMAFYNPIPFGVFVAVVTVGMMLTAFTKRPS